MSKFQKIISVVVALLAVLVLVSLFSGPRKTLGGGLINNLPVTFSQAVTFSKGATVGGDTNVIGNTAKTSYNKLTGYTKIDNRPTSNLSDYSLQVRAESNKTSGTHYGIDNETHLEASGTTSIRSTMGVAVIDSTFTQSGGSLVGVYGQARADGTFNSGSGFLTGVYGLIEEGGGAVTASHVSSAWLDSHRNTAVTGEHELLYMTNNGTATMDQAIFLYGGDKVTNFVSFDTVSGMVAGPSTAANGTPVKIQIEVNGTPYYINAYPTSNN